MQLPHDHDNPHAQDLYRQAQLLERFQAASELFHHLADPVRLRIFWVLCHCEECVIDISELLNMSSPAVSYHLRPMKAAGLLVSRREGKEVYYRAAQTPEAVLLHQMIEQIMEVSCPENQETVPQLTQEANLARMVHDHLCSHLSERITIEALAREFHTNPTTLKETFKSAYGTSVAAHMKTHRMDHAAKLLKTTQQPIAEIARAVGYDSQSKFTAAFKAYFGKLPRDYRK